MRKIEAVIRHHKLEEVKTALTAAGIVGMTVSEVRGRGTADSPRENYRGVDYDVDLQPRCRVEVVVRDGDCDRALAAILQSARTGQPGDGRIYVTELSEVVRVRTGEVNEAAL